MNPFSKSSEPGFVPDDGAPDIVESSEINLPCVWHERNSFRSDWCAVSLPITVKKCPLQKVVSESQRRQDYSAVKHSFIRQFRH